MTIDKKREKSGGGINPVIAGVAGAVVGAGIAIAGAMALKDDKSRAKIMGKLKDVKDQTLNIVEGAQDLIDEKKEMVGEKAQKVLNSTKNSRN